MAKTFSEWGVRASGVTARFRTKRAAMRHAKALKKDNPRGKVKLVEFVFLKRR